MQTTTDLRGQGSRRERRGWWLVLTGVLLLTGEAAMCSEGAEEGQATTQSPPSSPAAPLPLVPLPSVTPADPPQEVSPAIPAPPSVEYDPRYLYLPETAPPRAPEVCRPLGRWWISPSLELAWLPTPELTRDLRLAVLDADGSRFLGPYLLTANRRVPTFQAGLGLEGGGWFDSRNRYGFDASFFLLGGNATIFPGYAPEMLVLFPDGVRGGAPQLLVFPAGTPIIDVFPLTYSSWYTAVDINYRHNVFCADRCRLDLLLGYRHAFLQDELYFGEPPDGSTFDRHRDNRLAASNPFHGGQIGFAGEYRGGPWFVAGTVKVAWGMVHPRLESTGFFANTYARSPLAWQRLPSLDTPLEQQFAVLPALRLTVGRQFGSHLRLYAGYHFQYLSRVVRLADAIDPILPPRLTDVWVQSLSLGLEARF